MTAFPEDAIAAHVSRKCFVIALEEGVGPADTVKLESEQGKPACPLCLGALDLLQQLSAAKVVYRPGLAGRPEFQGDGERAASTHSGKPQGH